ncbi:MAG: DUF2993 domain-containing protein [Leptolyngbya foveolarum]|uniref:DUF2993 domain-containing protein n=1 Tax=Leptolyngbya foveolarum TaxID=47253 RepID=A0A2W4VYC6_9CYAN|nr:MAG: DUF2993 domain-containing protein [Leptolyngbya foveolarum]
MEVITVVLSSLLLLISPVGFVVDQVAEDSIRSRLLGVESLQVRVDNGSPLQLLQGRVNRVRIAGRGILPIEGLRIEVAELETDPIDLEFNSLRRGEVVLDEALQGALRLVLTEEDLNRYLASDAVAKRLSALRIGGLNPAQARDRDRYQINNPSVQFLSDNRLKVSLELEDLVQGGALQIDAESGLSVSAGDRLTLTEPILSVNGSPAPARLVETLLGSVNERLSLQRLERSGITARVINFSVQPDGLELAMWVRVDPSVTAATAGEDAMVEGKP